MSECLSKIRLENYHYIFSNLGYRDNTDIEKVLEDINKKKNSVVDSVLNSSVIDYNLRCIGELLSKDPMNQGKVDIKYIINCLRPFYKYKKTYDLIEKYKNI